MANKIDTAHAWNDPKVKAERIRSVRRAQVLRLLHDRHGKTLPHDRGGRAALQLLFELELDGVAGHRLAPWADGNEIDRLINAAEANWIDWSRRRDKGDPIIDPKLISERIGERLELSLEEYARLGLTHVRPCDAPRHAVDKFIRDRKANRDLNRRRRIRARAKQGAAIASADPWDLPDGRAKALACTALADHWQRWTIRRLTEYAREKLGDFAGLDHAAARKAVLRAIRELEKLGIVETWIEKGTRGLPVLHVRRLFTAAEIEAERQQLLDEVAAEQNPELS